MKKAFIFLIFTLIWGSYGYGQCAEWANPTSDQAYNVFEDLPCNGEMSSGVDFQIWPSDAYSIQNVMVGGTYTFSHCDGSGAWIPEYTVFAPSGIIEAFGAGINQCSFTWTANESGTYIIAVNEADNCGQAGTTNNGFPSITTLSGGENCLTPPILVEGAESFEGESIPECWQRIDNDEDGLSWALIDNESAFDGEQVMQSNSFFEILGAVAPDNWLIAEPRIVGENDSLYYAVASSSETFPNEFYGIYVAVNADTIGAFQEVFSEELTTTEWQGRSIDMSEYAGQLVYIAFRHYNSVDQSALLIDAVALPGEVVDNCSEVLSLWERKPELEFLVFPNPSKGNVSFSLRENSARVQVDVVDIHGRVVWSELVQLDGNNDQINLTNLLSGMYTVRITADKATGSQKLVIQ